MIKQRLLQKQSTLEKTLIDPDTILLDTLDYQPLLTCFKCQYEMLLGTEGRAKAIRIFNVA